MLKARKKLTKQELKHDPLLDSLEKGQQFYEENRQTIFTTVIGIVVVALLGWGWMNNRQSTNNEAMLANTKVILAANAGMDDNVLSELENVVMEYGSNPNISQATMQLGSAKMDAGDYAGARVEFSKLANSSDPMIKAGAKLKLAHLAELEQDYAQAAKLYTEVAKAKLGLGSERAHLQAGYAYFAAGDLDMASKIADELMAEKPTGEFKESIEYLQGKLLEK